MMKCSFLRLTGLLTLMTGCATTSVQTDPLESFDMDAAIKYFEAGVDDLTKNAKRARDSHFAKVTELCDAAFYVEDRRFYSARTTAESLFYMVQAAVEENESSVVSVPCGEASYLSAYASIDIGDIGAAERHLDSALRWSPRNSMYLAELGHIRHIQKRWDDALELFTQAEDLSGLAPEDVKQKELLRAKRGIGFSLIELGRIDEAKAKFLECLEVDPEDEGAKHELKYIDQLQSQEGEE